jgi:small subunit ribosomal protein S12
MITYNQLTRNKTSRMVKKHKRSRAKGLDGCPQKIGVCLRATTMKPKKPNSAIRKIAKVKLSNLRRATCYIPGRGHVLREFSQVLVRGGHVPDLPGVQYHLVRGKYDFFSQESENGGIERKNARSKYGIPRTPIKQFK